MKAILIDKNKFKRKKYRNVINIFPIIVVCLSIATSLMIASFFSTIITTSGIGLINTTTKTQGSLTLFALSLGTCNTFAQAEELSTSIKNKGGGGVIYKTDVFHVLASAYEIENDALKVQTNLNSQGMTSQIIKIEISQTSISANYTLNEVSALDDSLNAYKDAFRTLFELSISLDTQTKTEIVVKESINKLHQRLIKNKEDFALHLNKKLTANLVTLSLQNEKTTSIVKNLIETSKPLITEIKTAYLTIVINQAEMLSNLQTTVF